MSVGCVEAAIAAEAVDAVRNGRDRFLMLGEGSRFFDIRLPCGGGITLAIHVVKDAAPLKLALAHLKSRRRISLGYHPGTETIVAGEYRNATGWSDEHFVRGYRPKTRLVLCGRDLELEALRRLAGAAQYETVVFDLTQGHDESSTLIRRSLFSSMTLIGSFHY